MSVARARTSAAVGLAVLACACDYPRIHVAPPADGSTADAALQPSCVGLPMTCGPQGTSPCCASSLVPGGTFARSYDHSADNMFPDPSASATVSDFRLDTYEVTVGRFRQFVNAGKGTQADPPPPNAGARSLNGSAEQGGWDAALTPALPVDTAALTAQVNCTTYQSWTNTPGANESLPINCVSWYEAFAFCVWDGGFLPTEAEWNYAAAGGSDQRAFPWSNPASDVTVNCMHTNYNMCSPGVNRVGSESPVGDGLWGHADLGGNVTEWTLDGYHAQYTTPCDDCASVTTAGYYVLRGGSFFDLSRTVRTANRDNAPPTMLHFRIGFRCARRP